MEIKGNTALTDVECANTQITSLDIATLAELTSLIANDCLLTELDASNNLKLNTLYLQSNPLTKLTHANGKTIADLKLDNHEVIEYKWDFPRKIGNQVIEKSLTIFL